MSDNVIIKVNDLKKHFREGTIHALDGVSMEIRRGEVIVIVGPSGSGKSTFLRSLNLLELPTSGEILFEGVDINAPHVNINKHRQKMGMVFQHFNLFPHMTVLKNMTISGSSAEVGSSKSITSGFMHSARTMAIRCFCPPESWDG